MNAITDQARREVVLAAWIQAGRNHHDHALLALCKGLPDDIAARNRQRLVEWRLIAQDCKAEYRRLTRRLVAGGAA